MILNKSQEKILSLLIMYRLGLTLDELTRLMGVSSKTVSNNLSLLSRDSKVFQRRKGVWVHEAYRDPNPWR